MIQLTVADHRRWLMIVVELKDTCIALLRPEYQSLHALPSQRGFPGPVAVEVPGHLFDQYDDDSEEDSDETVCCADG